MNHYCCYDYDRVDSDMKWTREYIDKNYLKPYPKETLLHSSRNPKALYSFVLNCRRYWVQQTPNKPHHEAVDEYGHVHFNDVIMNHECCELLVRLPADVQCSARLAFRTSVTNHNIEMLTLVTLEIIGN